MLGPYRCPAGPPSSARADTGRMIRSAMRYHTAVVVMPPNITALKMYAAARIDSVAPNIAKKTAPRPHVNAERRTASRGAPRVIRRSESVGFRCCLSQAVLIA